MNILKMPLFDVLLPTRSHEHLTRCYVCTYVCMSVCMYIYIYECVCMVVCTYVCIYVYICMFVCMYVCTYVYIRASHKVCYMSTYTHTLIHFSYSYMFDVYIWYIFLMPSLIFSLLYVSVHIQSYINIDVHTYKHGCTQSHSLCLPRYSHRFLHFCIYIYTYIHTFI